VPSGAHTTTTAANTPAAGGSQNADIKNSGIFSPEAQARIHARAQEQLRSDLASWHARDLASEAALRAAPSRPYRTTAPLYDTDTAATEAEPGQVNQQIPGLAAGWRAAQATTPGQQEIPGVAAGWRAAQAVSPQAQTNQAVQAGLRAAQATTPNIPAGLPPQLATQAQTAQNPGPFGGAVANWANQAGSNLMARANQIGANVPATGLPSQLTGQQAQLPNVGGAIGTGAQNLGGALSGLAWRAGNWAAGLGANVPTTGLAPQLAQQNAVQAGLQAAQATPPPQGVPAPPVLPSQQPGAMPGSQFLPGGIPGAAAPAAPRVTQPAITQPRVVTPPGATPTRQTLFAHMAQAEQQYGLPHGTLYGHAMAESNMNPNARRLGAGADKSYGLMQFTTPTAQQYGLTNPYDPHASIDAAAHFISDLRRQFGGDTNKAIMAYNTGAGNVRKGNIGPGTRAYLPKVLGFIDQAPYARGGAVKHDDARQDRQQMLGILKEKGLTKARGGRFAKGGASADDTPPKAIPGKSVLRRAPHGKIALPVMHIAIMAIPKHKGAEKHASGGTIEIPPERQERRARRPGAVPPVKGKTPRGVGKALRGWGRTGQ
jgi:soluble lytic murein transglycosylase-like protein